MMKLCIFTGSLLMGYVFGYLATGLGIMWEIVISGIGSMVGVYAGWKFARWLDR